MILAHTGPGELSRDGPAGQEQVGAGAERREGSMSEPAGQLRGGMNRPSAYTFHGWVNAAWGPGATYAG